MKLEVILTDRLGRHLTRLSDFTELKVEIPLNDARTASFNVSVYDDATYHLIARPLDSFWAAKRGVSVGDIRGGPGDTLVKIIYRSALVFFGPIINLQAVASSGTIAVNAHDPTIWLKNHYHRYGDQVVPSASNVGESGYENDGRGVWKMLESTEVSDELLADHVKHPGILRGADTSTHFMYVVTDGDTTTVVEGDGPRPNNIHKPEDGDGVWRTMKRGDNVWDGIANLMTAVEGFDVSFEPIDEQHQPSDLIDEWEEGYFAAVYTYEHQGTDRTVGSTDVPLSEKVIFNFGFGLDNLSDFTFDPDLTVVRNYMVYVVEGGQDGEEDHESKALAQVPGSWVRYGIMQGWESSGSDEDTQQVLMGKARDTVKAFGYVPPVFSISPKNDVDVGLYYGEDFFIGDEISAQCKKGWMTTPMLHGRITRVTLAQDDDARNCRTEIEVVPNTVEPTDITEVYEAMGLRPQRDIVYRSVDHEERLRRIETNSKGGKAGYQTAELEMDGTWASGTLVLTQYGNVVVLTGQLTVTAAGHFGGDALPCELLPEQYRPTLPVGQRMTFFEATGGVDNYMQQTWVDVFILPTGEIQLGVGGDA